MTEEVFMTADVCACGLCDSLGHAKVTEREMTAEEKAEIIAMREESIVRKAAETAAAEAFATLKASAKAKLVAGQPLTEEEASTIVL